jgi:hypothetical protein
MHPDPLDRLIQAAETPIDPRTEFADALLHDLLAQLEVDQSERAEKETTVNTAIATSPMSGNPSPRLVGRKTAHRIDSPRRSFLLSHLATAALLLLTIVGGLYAVGTPGNLSLLRQSSPSVDNVLIASADVETMPETGLANLTYTGIARFTLEPGESMDSGPASYYGDGVYLFEVEAGVLSLASNGPTELLVGGSKQGTRVSEGANATLQTGDRGVIWPGVATTWRNDGQVPTVVLIAGAGEATNTASEFDLIDLVKSSTMRWPEPPVMFTFRRLTFEPGASLPIKDLPGLMMIAVATGEIDVPISYADGTTSDRGFGPLEGFVVTNWHLATDGDLHNSGSESVVIYVLAGESTVPAATPAP